jgi:hypothetical protein
MDIEKIKRKAWIDTITGIVLVWALTGIILYVLYNY